jgi:hypothetical protein
MVAALGAGIAQTDEEFVGLHGRKTWPGIRQCATSRLRRLSGDTPCPARRNRPLVLTPQFG